MEKPGMMYCRFCAELKRSDKLLDLETDPVRLEETSHKLIYLNATHVDFAKLSTLPKTICFVCWDSLNKAYEFFVKLSQAQAILANLHTENSDFKSNISDNDVSSNFDDFFLPDETESAEMDEETARRPPKKPRKDAISSHMNVDVKVEPKEESNQSVDDTVGQCSSITEENFEQSLNVQALLDVAMGDHQFTPNVEIYAKEVPQIPKKTIKKWKDYPWICVHCNNEFTDMNTLRMHSKSVHKNCAAFTCIDCQENVTSYNFDLFVAHVRKHRKSLR